MKRGIGSGVAGLLVLFVALTTWAGVSPAETRENRALGLLDVLAAGEPDRVLEYLEDNLLPEKWEKRSADEWTGIVEMLMSDLGEHEIVGIEADGDTHLDVEVAISRGTMNFGFDFADEAPWLISGLAIDMSANPGGRADRGNPIPSIDLHPGMSLDEVAAALERYFQGLADADLFSGTAMVSFGGQPLFEAAHGLASRRFEVPNEIGTRFDLGSINKTFTRIAVAKLLAAKKLKLDDTIAAHIDDYPDPDVAKRVTVRHLLDHSSGLGDIFNERFFATAKDRLREPRDYFPLFAGEELLFEPGTSKRYSNAGFMVLGAIIEEVAGMPFDDYIVKTVFEPAGMKDTGFFAHDEPVRDVAIGYTRQGSDRGDGELRNNILMLPVKGSPAGSAYSTVADLLRFDDALRGYRLLPEPWTRWVFDGPLPGPEPASGGSGGRLDIGTAMAGGAPGVSAVLEIDGDLVIVILSNYDAPVSEDIAARIRRPLRKALTSARGSS